MKKLKVFEMFLMVVLMACCFACDNRSQVLDDANFQLRNELKIANEALAIREAEMKALAGTSSSALAEVKTATENMEKVVEEVLKASEEKSAALKEMKAKLEAKEAEFKACNDAKSKAPEKKNVSSSTKPKPAAKPAAQSSAVPVPAKPAVDPCQGEGCGNRDSNPRWKFTGQNTVNGIHVIYGQIDMKGGPWIQSKWFVPNKEVQIVVTNWDGKSDISSRLDAAEKKARQTGQEINSKQLSADCGQRHCYVCEH